MKSEWLNNYHITIAKVANLLGQERMFRLWNPIILQQECPRLKFPGPGTEFRCVPAYFNPWKWHILVFLTNSTPTMHWVVTGHPWANHITLNYWSCLSKQLLWPPWPEQPQTSYIIMSGYNWTVRNEQSLAAFRQQLKTVLFRTSFGEDANSWAASLSTRDCFSLC